MNRGKAARAKKRDFEPGSISRIQNLMLFPFFPAGNSIRKERKKNGPMFRSANGKARRDYFLSDFSRTSSYAATAPCFPAESTRKTVHPFRTVKGISFFLLPSKSTA